MSTEEPISEELRAVLTELRDAVRDLTKAICERDAATAVRWRETIRRVDAPREQDEPWKRRPGETE